MILRLAAEKASARQMTDQEATLRLRAVELALLARFRKKTLEFSTMGESPKAEQALQPARSRAADGLRELWTGRLHASDNHRSNRCPSSVQYQQAFELALPLRLSR